MSNYKSDFESFEEGFGAGVGKEEIASEQLQPVALSIQPLFGLGWEEERLRVSNYNLWAYTRRGLYGVGRGEIASEQLQPAIFQIVDGTLLCGKRGNCEGAIFSQAAVTVVC